MAEQKLDICVGNYLNVLDNRRLRTIKVDHDKMHKAIYSKAPKKREMSTMLIMKQINFNELQQQTEKHINSELSKLNIPQYAIQKLTLELRNKVEFSNAMGEIYVDFSNHFNNNLSDAWGGNSHVGVGIIGFVPVKDDKNKVMFISCGHHEDWKEYDNVRINKKAAVWGDDVLYNFLLHQLWGTIQRELPIAQLCENYKMIKKGSK